MYRMLPHSLEAERGLLGSMLISPVDVIGECVERIDLLAFQHRGTPDDFLLHREELAALRTKAAQHGDTASVDILTEPPEEPLARARMWITAAESWRKRHAGVLGDEALSYWHEITGWQQG